MTAQELVQKVKQAVDIVEVIGEQVALKRAGARYKGLSPFTKEKTPSFFVNPDTQNFYCFSTNKGGDVIDFLVETRGMDFREALAWLAEKAGIELPRGSSAGRAESKSEKEALKKFLKINRFVAHFFQMQFRGPAGARAREYAKSRGLEERTLKEFAIGFAPDSWNALRDHLIAIKAPLDAALTLGLLKTRAEEASRADGANLYDLFRDRLIFPIRDAVGEVVGFGGRGLDPQEKIKYLNSSESPVFNKGQMFFNFDRARKYIRELEEVIVVEGYMDCIALDQAGFPNVVATLGTALTPHHVQILRKTARRVVNLYDSDAAGQAASLRNMDLFLKEAGVAIAGVRLGEGKDPDEFLRARPETGVAELRALLHQAPALLDTWVDETIQAAPRTVQGRADCVNKISERLAFLTDPVGIQARVMDVAERLVLAPSIVMEAVQAQKKQSNQAAIKVKAPPKATQKPAHLSPMQKTEKFARQNDKTWGRFEARFLRYLLLYPERLRELRRMHQADAEVVLPRIENPVVAKVIAHLLQPINTSGEETESRRLSGLIEALDLRQETELKNFVAKALAENSGVLPPPASLAEVLRKVNFERSERGAESLRAQIKLAEASGDSPRVEVLQRELISLIQNSKKIQLEDANG